MLTLIILFLMARLDHGGDTQLFTFIRLSILSVLFVVVHGLMLGGMVTDVSATDEKNNSSILFWFAFGFSVAMAVAQMYFGGDF